MNYDLAQVFCRFLIGAQFYCTLRLLQAESLQALDAWLILAGRRHDPGAASDPLLIDLVAMPQQPARRDALKPSLDARFGAGPRQVSQPPMRRSPVQCLQAR